MKKAVLVLLLVVFSVFAFSDVIGYLTKNGKVLEDYSLDEKTFEIEFLNRMNSLQQSGQYDKFQEPYYMLSTIKVLINYMILEYYAKENGYEPDMEKVNQQIEDIIAQYFTNPQTKEQVIDYFGSEESFKNYLKNNILMNEYYSYVDQNIGNVSNDDIDNYLKENFETLKLNNEKVLTKHILVTDEASANTILNEIKNGNISFEDAARKYSIDTQSGQNGGNIDWVAKNQVVHEYFDAAFNAKVGQIVGPIKSDYGYHIIKLEGKKSYNSIEDMKSDNEFMNKVISDLKNEKLYNWYMDYSKDFSYALKYEPLIYEEKIEKAETLNEKMDIERKLYDAIRANENAPASWKLSYLNLLKELNQTLPEAIELENIISKYKNSEYINMTEDELGNQIDSLENKLNDIKDENEKTKITELKKDLEGLYYAKVMYPELFESTIENAQNYLEGLKIKEFNILKDFYLQEKDMETLIRLYELNPDDPEISFEYNYTYYQYIKQYITSQPKDVIQPELEKILKAFENVVANTDNEEIKTESQKIIEEIKATLKNMME
jgi:parvulin-like peptidyl-prolyl isomerase